MLNTYVVFSTQCPIMLKGYIIMLKRWVILSTKYVNLSVQLVSMQMGVLFCVHNILLCQRLYYYVTKLGYLVYEVCELVYTTSYYLNSRLVFVHTVLGWLGRGMQPRKLQCCIWRYSIKPSLWFSLFWFSLFPKAILFEFYFTLL